MILIGSPDKSIILDVGHGKNFFETIRIVITKLLCFETKRLRLFLNFVSVLVRTYGEEGALLFYVTVESGHAIAEKGSIEVTDVGWTVCIEYWAHNDVFAAPSEE